MSQLRTLPVAALLSVLAACTAGSGPGKPLTVERDPVGGQEPGATGPEPATGGRESPGGGTENGGNGGGAGDSGVTCVKCDATYSCVLSDNGQSATGTVALAVVNGECVIGDNQGVIHCDGTITSTSTDANGNQSTVTIQWTPYGDGGFQYSANGATGRCSPVSGTTVTPPQPSPAPTASAN
jgi:hypothetical protein